MDFSKLVIPDVVKPEIKVMNPVFSSISVTSRLNYQGCSKCGTERNFRIDRDSATCCNCGHTYNFMKRE